MEYRFSFEITKEEFETHELVKYGTSRNDVYLLTKDFNFGVKLRHMERKSKNDILFEIKTRFKHAIDGFKGKESWMKKSTPLVFFSSKDDSVELDRYSHALTHINKDKNLKKLFGTEKHCNIPLASVTKYVSKRNIETALFTVNFFIFDVSRKILKPFSNCNNDIFCTTKCLEGYWLNDGDSKDLFDSKIKENTAKPSFLLGGYPEFLYSLYEKHVVHKGHFFCVRNMSNKKLLHVCNDHKNIGTSCSDKELSIVIKRIATKLNGISETRGAKIAPKKMNNYTYNDIELTAKCIVEDYERVFDSFETVVFSSVMRSYIPDVLNCPVFPLQFLTYHDSINDFVKFYKNVEENKGVGYYSIIHRNYDRKDCFWVWNKFNDIKHFPEAYKKVLKKCKNVVVYHSLNKCQKGDSIIGTLSLSNDKNVKVFVHSSLEKMRNKKLDDELYKVMNTIDKYTYAKIQDTTPQIEFGLPKSTYMMIEDFWTTKNEKDSNYITTGLGRSKENIIKVTGYDKGMYKFAPIVWKELLRVNGIKIKGVSIMPYWTCHPSYELYAGIVPCIFYDLCPANAGLIRMYGDIMVDVIKSIGGVNKMRKEWFYCFSNKINCVKKVIEGGVEVIDLDRNYVYEFFNDVMLESFGVDEFLKNKPEKVYYSYGFDCTGSKVDVKCSNQKKEHVDVPYKKVFEWMGKKENSTEKEEFFPKKFEFLKFEELKVLVNFFIQKARMINNSIDYLHHSILDKDMYDKNIIKREGIIVEEEENDKKKIDTINTTFF